jgi:penicillin-binding protein 2
MISEDRPEDGSNANRRHFSFRINAVFFCTFLLFSVLIIKLAVLQFVEGKQLLAKKNSTVTSSTPIEPIRGNIYDANGYPLAYTKPVQSLYFRVESGQDPDEVIALAKRLADIFKQYGDKNSKNPTAAEIMELMDVGYDLNKKPTKAPSYYSVPRCLKTPLSDNEIAYIEEHRDELKWLEVTEESIREYAKEPNGDPNDPVDYFAAQLVGYLRPFATARSQQGLDFYRNPDLTSEYLDKENVGFDGIELMYQNELRGINGTKSYPVNALMKIVGPPTVTAPQKGDNITLTINKDVQLAAQHAIMDQLTWLHSNEARNNPYAKEGVNAKAGYAVAMEVDTGKIIAMASMPDYDPNVWTSGLSGEQYKAIQPFVNNGAITTAYPDYPTDELRKHPNSIVYMGSTIKPLSVLLGLNEGLFTASETYNDTGRFSFGKEGHQSTISNSDGEAWGPINATMGIAHSSNVFMSAMIGNRLYFNKQNGLDIFKKYLNAFGIGVSTGSGLPREYYDDKQLEFYSASKNDSLQSALIYASWGQNEKATTLQLAQYAAMLANKGKRMQPLLVDKITTYDGQVLEQSRPKVLNEMDFPDEDWNAIYQGMAQVHIEGFNDYKYGLDSILRKTGTSTQGVSGGTVDNAVFIAFAPAAKPKLAVAVVVPEGGFGAWGAAPIARKIFDAYDQYVQPLN